tara:strand:+ start:50 stop:679 length:630 start_codon:yes stop_codon:yes gene_type:complete
LSEVKLTADSGGGTVAWKAPASTTSNAAVTLTLPQNDGDADQVLATNGSGVLSWAAAGGGKLLNYATGTTNTQVAITSTTYTDSGLTASITPSATSSKILVLVDQNARIQSDGGNSGWGIQLLRDSTVIVSPSISGGNPMEPYLENNSESFSYNLRWHYMFLDSPSSTSSVTYKTQGRVKDTNDSKYIKFQLDKDTNGTSNITLLEIAG